MKALIDIQEIFTNDIGGIGPKKITFSKNVGAGGLESQILYYLDIWYWELKIDTNRRISNLQRQILHSIEKI